MADRVINIGDSEADANFQIIDDGGDLIIDVLGSSAQFWYDSSVGEWKAVDSAGNSTTIS